MIWPKPNYQAGLGASPLRRDVPDVSLNADPATGYDVFVNGVVNTGGGTSASAPLWAAFTALVNEQRGLNGLTTPLGFANPPLYALGRSTQYTTVFHDITVGDNLLYQAQAGLMTPRASARSSAISLSRRCPTIPTKEPVRRR